MARQITDNEPDNEPIDILPWRVVIDTREQAPFHFHGLKSDSGRTLIVPLVTDIALAAGDYSIQGMEDRISVERKSVGDWFGSIGRGRERFEKEMERLSELDFAAVVIEGDWESLLLTPPASTQVSPKVASRTIASWAIRYGVHFYPCMNRRHAELWTFGLLSMFWRQQQAKQQRQQEVADEIAAAVG